MVSIGFGVMVYNRLRRFERLLETLPTDFVNHVYIVNDGKWTTEKQDIVDHAIDIECTVIDPDDENVNLGRGRELIVEESSEEYLLVSDSDNLVPENVHVLLDILEGTGYGGVCGLLVEPSNDRIYTGCRGLHVDGETYIREIRDEKEVEICDGHSYVEFEYLSGPLLLRRECLDDYAWDPTYRIGYDHGDFFVGHKKRTDWSFALVPSVMFHHYPGGGTEYMSRRRNQEEKFQQDKTYFYEKWGFTDQEKTGGNYLDTERTPNRSVFMRGLGKIKRLILSSVL